MNIPNVIHLIYMRLVSILPAHVYANHAMHNNNSSCLSDQLALKVMICSIIADREASFFHPNTIYPGALHDYTIFMVDP